MGIQQMTQRNWRWLLLIAAVIILILAIIGLVIVMQQAPPKAQGLQTVEYTDSITGQHTTDYPNKGPEIQSEALGAQVQGAAEFYKVLTEDQASNLQIITEKFATAHSNQPSSTARVKDNSIKKLNEKTIQFTLAIMEPTAFYEITVTFVNQYQLIPAVMFKRVE